MCVVKQPKPIDESKYRGEWLALDKETREVIAHGPVLRKVATEARQKGWPKPVFHPVPEAHIHCTVIK